MKIVWPIDVEIIRNVRGVGDGWMQSPDWTDDRLSRWAALGLTASKWGKRGGALLLCFGANMHAYKWNNMQVVW